MLRILHIGLSSNLGGIENFIINLYRNIDKSLVQFDFIIPYGENPLFYDELVKSGSRLYHIVSRKKNIYQSYRQLKNIIEKEHYKIVHFHVNTLSYITPIIICNKLKNVKIIVHSHNEWKGKSIKTKILHKINFNRIKNKDYVRFACSEVAGRWLFKNKEYEVIKNGIDVSRFKFNKEKRNLIRKSLNVKDNELLIGHVGRFGIQKNHRFLIEVFNKYQKNNYNVKLLLIGTGELKDQVKSQIDELGLSERVIILENKLNIEDYYNSMDIFLLPSLFEGLALVLIEAQINGLPCLVSDKVSKEANVTDKIMFLSIENGVESWVDAISNCNCKRYDEIEKIKIKGYDIKDTARKVQEKYIKLEKEIE